MFWVRLFFLLFIASLLIFIISKILINKELKIIVIAFIISILIDGFTGVSYNFFYDKFDLNLFIKSIIIWIIAYFGARLIINKLNS